MKKHSYFLLIATIFGILTYFLGDKVLLPFDESGLIDTTSIIIMGIFSNITTISFFSYVLISIDKLFNKDKAKDSRSIRRAILITLLLDFFAFLRIFGLWSRINFGLSIGIIFFAEMLFSTPEEKVDEIKK